MELQDFVEQSVSDIINAVHNLKEKYNTAGHGVIAPYAKHNDQTQCHQINFDIAISSAESNMNSTSGKAGIRVIGASINGEKNSEHENSSRIKFSIPFFPESIDNCR